MYLPASRMSTVPGVMVDLRATNQTDLSVKLPHNGIERERETGDAPELGGLGLAGADGARLDVVGGVELGLGDGGGRRGLGEGSAILGLDGPEAAAVVGVGPRRALDAQRHLRRRSHWGMPWVGGGGGGAAARGGRRRRWRKKNGRACVVAGLYVCGCAEVETLVGFWTV
jgi:hypothetical protein